MLNTPVITIDGPVASGKGTIARGIAEALNFGLLDSGAIYRGHAQACLSKKISCNEINLLEVEAKALCLKFIGEEVWLDGVDATASIRSEAVGMAASTLSAIPQVRAALLQRQRDFAAAPGLVADGRDMGTIVFPNALLKIYLTATAQVRAQRRAGQLAKHLIDKGKSPRIVGSLGMIRAQVQHDVEDQIRRRDWQDKSRSIAPLKPAIDAIVIDNAAHSPDETVAAILRLWHLRLASTQAS